MPYAFRSTCAPNPKPRKLSGQSKTWRSSRPLVMRRVLRSRLGGLHFLDHLAQFFQGDVLDLAAAFAGDAEFLAALFQGTLGPAIQTEAGAQDGGLADVEVLDHLLQHAGDGFFFELFVGGVGGLVLDDFGEEKTV